MFAKLEYSAPTFKLRSFDVHAGIGPGSRFGLFEMSIQESVSAELLRSGSEPILFVLMAANLSNANSEK